MDGDDERASAAGEIGPRNVGQWRTSTTGAPGQPRQGQRVPHTRRGRRSAARPEPPRRSGTSSTPVRSLQARDVARGAGARLVERRDVEADASSARGQVRRRGRPGRYCSTRTSQPAQDRARRARPAVRARSSIAAAIALGSVRIGAHGGVAARLVHRLVRRADDRVRRRPSPRSPAARSPRTATGRRTPRRRGRAVRARRRRRSRAWTMPGRSSAGCSPQPSAPTTASRRSSRPSSAMRLDERREVLARLERRHREDVRRRRARPRRRRAEDGVDSGQRHAHTLLRHAEQLDDVASAVNAEFAKTRSQRAAPRSGTSRCACGACGPAPTPGWRSGTRSWIVVARITAALRRIHPVGEVEHVDRPEEALDAGHAEAAPTLAPEMREREELERHVDGDALRARQGSPSSPAGSSARRRRSRARPRPPRRDPPASRGGTCRSPSAGARAARRRRRSSRSVAKRLKCMPSSPRVRVLAARDDLGHRRPRRR